MATTSYPRRRGLPRRWLILAAVVVAVAIGAGVYINANATGASVAGPATVNVSRGPLVATVAGSGSVAAEQTLNLAFQTNGTVTEVLVKEGDTVLAGQELVRLDDRSLQSQVKTAASGVDSAKARLAQAQKGNARPEDVAAAQAAVASAEANYAKAAKGPSAEEQASAEAAVRSAQAAYDAAKNAAGTTDSQLLSARATLEKANAALHQAQGNYDKVAWLPDIAARPEALALQSATIDFQQAEANYESLVQTADPNSQSKTDSAAAQLAQAKANLARLAPAAEDLTVAQASVDQARANLAKVGGAATASDIQIQQAAVTQAEQTLQQAQLALANATLRAPFGGVVAQVSAVPGSQANSATSALRLINRNPLHVDLRLTENDVAKVQTGQPVKLSIQSLGDWQGSGSVIYVAPAADNVNGVVTYVVRASFPDNEPRVKVGMTADLSIEVARRDGALLVPNTALLPKGTGRIVQVVDDKASAGQQAVREVDVRVGLSDGTNTEILSGLSEGQQVVAFPDSGVRRNSGSGGFFGG
jgi:HlyD family secretion protein